MCGINGIIEISKTNIINHYQNVLESMNICIKHRGPDGKGLFVSEKNSNIVGLGQVRLSIIDLSDAGFQPMFYNKSVGAFSEKYNQHFINEYGKKSLVMVFNGEIYNYKDIKSELENKGYIFSTKSDSEVILAAYIEYGIDCVKKFNGMWALCIYDPNKDIVFCSRDRMGKKPFYYYWDGNKFIFSSEIKGILDTGTKRELNKESLVKYLALHYTSGEATLFKDIYKLSHSTNLVINLNNGEINKSRYRDIDNDKIKYKNLDEAIEQVDYLVNDAVKIRTMASDVPVGTFLSGGLDSSLTSALFKKYYTGGEFHTFNVVWDDNIPNESKYAEIVANHLGTTHHKVQVTGKDVLAELNKLQYHYCDPIAEAGFIPNYFVSKYANQFVKVILTGDGGDEVFGGYSYYNFLQKFWKLGKVPGVKHISKVLSKMLGISKFQKGFEFLSNADKHNYGKFFGLAVSSFSVKELEDLISNDYHYLLKDVFGDMQNTYKKDFDYLINQLLYTDQNVLLPDCYNIKPDKAMMANGIEGRAPLQDYRLAEFMYHANNKFKINNGIEKYLLKEVGKKYLPREIFERKKQGYGVPMFEWINNDLKNSVTTSLGDLNNNLDVLDNNKAQYYLNNIDNKYLSTRIWVLYSLKLFIDEYKL